MKIGKDWTPVTAIRKIGNKIEALILGEKKRTANSGRTKNISEGFYANGVFHPIRSASDYDESRVGETRVARKKSASKKKASTQRDRIDARSKAFVARPKTKPRKSATAAQLVKMLKSGPPKRRKKR